MTWPDAQFEITSDTVHDLLAQQQPHLVHEPIVEIGVGFDNSIWRLGDRYAALDA